MNQPYYNPDDLLRGYAVEDFPGRHVYPLEACPEPRHDWNLKYSDFGDARTGNVRLETVWHPIWAGTNAPLHSEVLPFFGEDSDTYPTLRQGAFIWPKRYHLWEVAFECAEASPGDIATATVHVQIGEKTYLKMPFALLLTRGAPTGRLRRFIPLCQPLYIPPVQYFNVSLQWALGDTPTKPSDITCVLGGYLHREIC